MEALQGQVGLMLLLAPGSTQPLRVIMPAPAPWAMISVLALPVTAIMLPLQVSRDPVPVIADLPGIMVANPVTQEGRVVRTTVRITLKRAV